MSHDPIYYAPVTQYISSIFIYIFKNVCIRHLPSSHVSVALYPSLQPLGQLPLDLSQGFELRQLHCLLQSGPHRPLAQVEDIGAVVFSVDTNSRTKEYSRKHYFVVLCVCLPRLMIALPFCISEQVI